MGFDPIQPSNCKKGVTPLTLICPYITQYRIWNFSNTPNTVALGARIIGWVFLLAPLHF